MGESGEEIEKGPDYFVFRGTSDLQQFSIPRGESIIYILFEEIPFWLTALSPLMCRRLFFVQYDSVKQLTNKSIEVESFWKCYGNLWPSDKLRFNSDTISKPDLVLISGSPGFIANPKLGEYSVPTIVTHEFRLHSKLVNPLFKFGWYKHNVNGGCTNFRLGFGFNNLTSPIKIAPMERALGDFIDYSIHPTVRLKAFEFNSKTDLCKDSCLSFKTLKYRLIIPTYKFASGWGSRYLDRQEYFNIWGLSNLEKTSMELDRLFDLSPTQPASLLLASMFTVTKSKLIPSKPRVGKLQEPVKISNQTMFDKIGVTINHDWIDDTVVLSPTRKADNAPVPASLWDKRIMASFPGKPITTELLALFRMVGMSWYRKNLRRSFINYLRYCFSSEWDDYLLGKRHTVKGGESEFQKSLEFGVDVLMRADRASWFDWTDGSALVFWRWHDFKIEARDGFPTHFLDSSMRQSSKKFYPPMVPADSRMRSLLEEKLNRIVQARYISDGYAHWDIRYFHVPKGEEDIRIVYDGSKNGINTLVWVPTFFVAISESLGRLLEPGTYQMDSDIGEMFLNFMLNKDVRCYCGVNVTGLDLEEAVTDRYRWDRLWMGYTASPHNAVRHLEIGMEFVMGDPLELGNAFYWDKLVLNLPCTDSFNPGMPWIYKLDSRVGRIACDQVKFMDDFRSTGYSVESCWQAGRQVASRLQFLGMQDAARKKKPPSLDAQAWAGCIIKTDGEDVEKTVSQEKWDKAKSYLKELKRQAGTEEQPGMVNHKFLQRARGFFNHLGITIEFLPPALKGFHNAIDGWRDGRDEEGFRDEALHYRDVLEAHFFSGRISEEVYESLMNENPTSQKPPEEVLAIPELFRSIEFLEAILDMDTPVRYPVRFTKTVAVLYGFVDASGRGFAGMFEEAGQENVEVDIGVWSTKIENESTGNWKEFENLVSRIEIRAEKGELSRAMLIMGTDSAVVEGAVDKGNSSSKELFRLVCRLRKCQMRYGFALFITHVAGTRMIAQGTDGLSRGVLNKGSLATGSVRNYLPVNLTALDRSEELASWLRTWLLPETIFLSPEQWFIEAQDLRFKGSVTPREMSVKRGCYLWAPQPCIANVALELLRTARLKRHQSLHVMIIPKLFYAHWRRQFHKAMDLILYLPPRWSFWSQSMHETLIFGFCFPYSRYKPWSCKGTPKLRELERSVQTLWKGNGLDGRDNLRQFLLAAWKFPTMPFDVVRHVLYFEPRSDISREGETH